MPQDFYPGCKLRLKVRLDDGQLTPPLPSVGVPSPLGAEAFPQATDALFLALPDFEVIDNIVPLSCSVELNPYRTADTAKFDISFRQLPFDPQRIRAMTVEIFGGVYTSSEWADANGPLDAPGLVMPDVPGPATAVVSSTGPATNLLFQGFADDVDLDLDIENQTISIAARDLTGELLDAEAPPNILKDIPALLPLDLAIQLLLTGDGVPVKELSRRFGLPGFRGIIVVADVVNSAGIPVPLPSLNDIKPKTFVDSRGTAKRGRRKSPGNNQKKSYWDVITSICVEAGFRCYIRQGTIPVTFPGSAVALLPAAELVITNPATYYRQSTTTGTGTGFLAEAQVRQFVWGLNCKLGITQKLKKVKVPTIRVTTFDTALGESVSATYPPIPVNNRPAASGTGDRQEIKVFNVNAISGLTRLQLELYLDANARTIYEELGRGDKKVTISTKTLAALPQNFNSQTRADLFALRPRDPVLVFVPGVKIEEGLVGDVARLSNASVAERVQDLIKAGYDPITALFLARVLDNPYLQEEFRTQKVNLEWNKDSGWEIKVEAINYLDTRAAVAAVDLASGRPAP